MLHLFNKQFSVIATLFVVSSLAAASIASAAGVPNGVEPLKNPNVIFYRGYMAPAHRVVNWVRVYLGKGKFKVERPSVKEGGLYVSKSGMVSIHLAKNEVLQNAYVDYGTNKTPAFGNMPFWSGDQAAPYAFIEGSNEKNYKIKMSSITVIVYQKGRPSLPTNRQ